MVKAVIYTRIDEKGQIHSFVHIPRIGETIITKDNEVLKVHNIVHDIDNESIAIITYQPKITKKDIKKGTVSRKLL